MIAAITAWVKTIILVVLFASFMELLLPNTGMKKFIRVIMGIFIMLAILNPMLLFFQREKPAEPIAVMGAKEPGTNLQKDTITQLVESTVNRREELLAAAYKQGLASQISAVAKSVAGVEDAKAKVSIGPDNKISKIVIYVKQGEISSKTIKIDAITLSKPEKPIIQSGLTEKVTRIISELYQVPPQEIEVEPIS